MPQIIIQKKRCSKHSEFYRDGVLIGTSRYTYGFLMDEIVIYKDNSLKYRFSETNRIVWFLRNCIPLISLVISFFLNGRYIIFDKNIKIGHSEERWLKPVESFIIQDDHYHLFTHKNEQFSLTKNGEQIALANCKCKLDTRTVEI